MGTQPINEILDRLDELRSVFVLDRPDMPFLEEVFAFLSEILPVLDEVDRSIQMSTNALMPGATARLASVTRATELATTEIMDQIDAAYDKLAQAKEKIEESREHLVALYAADQRLLSLLETRIDDQTLVAMVASILEEKAVHRNTVAEILTGKARILDEIRVDLNSIMMSLQVQDITSQQIAAVSHLIHSVKEVLQKFEGQLGSGTLESFLDPSSPENVTFDIHASYDHSGKKQATADEVVAGSDDRVKAPPAGLDTQRGIDTLFKENGSLPAGDGATASQRAIDALFNAHDPASREDIEPDVNHRP